MTRIQVADNGSGARRRKSIREQGISIANAAHRSVGTFMNNPRQVSPRDPQYALTVSRIFTKATNQKLMPEKDPEHVLSTAHLWRSLSRDKRFEQVPMSEVAPGDIIIASHPSDADGYAGIVAEHGRVISNSYKGVRDDSSLQEVQRSEPGTNAFRYVGVWHLYRKALLANEGYDPDQPRLPTGQAGGGRWTSGGAMAPSTPVLSGASGLRQSANTGKDDMTRADRDGKSGMVPLTDAERNLLRERNAEALAIIAKYGGGVSLDTPESILSGKAKPGDVPDLPISDLRSQYPGRSDEDIALLESTRSNGVKAMVALAHSGLLPKSQVMALQLRGLGVLADATLSLSLALAPYDSIAALGARDLLGPTESTIGAETGATASRSAEISDKPISASLGPNYAAVKWVREPSTIMRENASTYQDGAAASQFGKAPQLSATDSTGTVTAKFDGVDASTGEMVDAKLGLGGDSPSQALRQSATAAAHGFRVRWEVPNASIQAAAQRQISSLGIKNIRVVIRPK